MNMPPVDLSAIAKNLVMDTDGIWVSRSRTEISYPEEGNENCLVLEADSYWFEHRNRCIQAVMQRFSPPGRVFDIGGGNGYVAAGLQQAGIPVALVEPGWQGVQNARARGVELLVCSTLEDAHFSPGLLPAVSLFDVLEHIQNDRQFLESIYQLLIPGGRIYLTVPAFQALWSKDDVYAGHYRRYRLGDVSRLLQDVGFRVEYSSYIFFMLPLPIFLFRSIPSRLGLQKQEDWQRYEKEHRSQTDLIGCALHWMLQGELRQVRAGHPLPIGGSCLVAAVKPAA